MFYKTCVTSYYFSVLQTNVHLPRRHGSFGESHFCFWAGRWFSQRLQLIRDYSPFTIIVIRSNNKAARIYANSDANINPCVYVCGRTCIQICVLTCLFIYLCTFNIFHSLKSVGLICIVDISRRDVPLTISFVSIVCRLLVVVASFVVEIVPMIVIVRTNKCVFLILGGREIFLRSGGRLCRRRDDQKWCVGYVVSSSCVVVHFTSKVINYNLLTVCMHV